MHNNLLLTVLAKKMGNMLRTINFLANLELREVLRMRGFDTGASEQTWRIDILTEQHQLYSFTIFLLNNFYFMLQHKNHER